MSELLTERQLYADRIRQVLERELKVHTRLQDQGHAPDAETRRALALQLPDLVPFGHNEFHAVRFVLDWDHQLPSQYMLLRVFACYDATTTDRVDANIEHVDEEIAEANLYPEFDVPDYGDIEGSETYVAIMRPGQPRFEEFRFLSAWRRHVSPQTAELAVTTARSDPRFKDALARRNNESLSGPVVIGWSPPSLSDSINWAIEVWLLVEFDGQFGRARVFMVDPVEKRVTKDYETDVQLA